MDQILLPYVQATDESARQELFNELLIVYASPVVRRTLRQKLGFYVNPSGVNPYNPDAEDLYHEIIAKIIEVLTAPPSAPRTEIEDFAKYVGRIALNSCLDYIRMKSPARTRLKYSLRELLTRNPEFGIWKYQEDFLCGLKRWGTSPAASAQRMAEIETDLPIFRTTRFGGEEITAVPLAVLTSELFKWIDQPMELDELVNLIGILLEIKDRPTESLDDEGNQYLESRVSDTTLVSNSGHDRERLLRTLWQAVLALPKTQRDAFCLRFEDDDGEDLFTLLFEADITTYAQLAQHLGRSLEDVMRIWTALPMDYPDIAAEMNASVVQVRRWRFDALRRLEKDPIFRTFLRRK